MKFIARCIQNSAHRRTNTPCTPESTAPKTSKDVRGLKSLGDFFDQLEHLAAESCFGRHVHLVSGDGVWEMYPGPRGRSRGGDVKRALGLGGVALRFGGAGGDLALVPWKRPRKGRRARAWGVSGAGAWQAGPGASGGGRQCLSGVTLCCENNINLVGYGFPCEISRKLDS